MISINRVVVLLRIDKECFAEAILSVRRAREVLWSVCAK